MNVINIVDNNLLFALLLIITVYIITKKPFLNLSEQYLVYLCVNTFTILILDTSAWMVNGLPDAVPHHLLTESHNVDFQLFFRFRVHHRQ